MDLESFGSTLRLRRQELDKTLADVGRSAGCTRQNVHKVERALSNPTIQTLERIADALDLRLELSLVEKDTPPWPAGDPDSLERAVIESQLLRLARLAPSHRLDELSQALSSLEARIIPATVLEERARSEQLAELLVEAGIEPGLALDLARQEADKPADWEAHPDRFAALFDRARGRMAN